MNPKRVGRWTKSLFSRYRVTGLDPVSRRFGFDRGQPIDRYYIEEFLSRHSSDIRGRVLEIGDPMYTRKFGKTVTKSDVLHIRSDEPHVTITGNLETGEGIPQAAFDCLILTQVFPFMFDVQTAIMHSCKALRVGGVALVTFPGISQISRYDMDRWGDFWRFTDASARRLFSNAFGAKDIHISTYGNVRAASAFLYGLAAHELKRNELAYHDRDYPVIIGVRAVREETDQ